MSSDSQPETFQLYDVQGSWVFSLTIVKSLSLHNALVGEFLFTVMEFLNR